MNESTYITVAQAAAIMGCTKHYINQYIRAKRLTPRYLSTSQAVNTKRYIARQELTALMDELDAEARRIEDHARAKKHVAALREKHHLFGRNA